MLVLSTLEYPPKALSKTQEKNLLEMVSADAL